MHVRIKLIKTRYMKQARERVIMIEQEYNEQYVVKSEACNKHARYHIVNHTPRTRRERKCKLFSGNFNGTTNSSAMWESMVRGDLRRPWRKGQ
ncbi:hypothetical protein Taro_003412 [Colocasia esculenta]|uniref:Uncharacterized protein n=1 Tax=Colocasia esculenta TaxID=4460 RepID=A0A843TNQ7_COLES|nr:hypothetical protein [Colocasia esculenta]